MDHFSISMCVYMYGGVLVGYKLGEGEEKTFIFIWQKADGVGTKRGDVLNRLIM